MDWICIFGGNLRTERSREFDEGPGLAIKLNHSRGLFGLPQCLFSGAEPVLGLFELLLEEESALRCLRDRHTFLHIAAIAGAVRDCTPRTVPAARSGTLLAGLEPMVIAA